jgi:DNA-binding MarR family transcriptional regulator
VPAAICSERAGSSARISDRAEKRGLLRRTPNPIDGRAVDVFLSKQGMELADRGATQIAESLSPMTGTLSRADTHRLTTLLTQMLAAPTRRGHRPAKLI